MLETGQRLSKTTADVQNPLAPRREALAASPGGELRSRFRRSPCFRRSSAHYFSRVAASCAKNACPVFEHPDERWKPRTPGTPARVASADRVQFLIARVRIAGDGACLVSMWGAQHAIYRRPGWLCRGSRVRRYSEGLLAPVAGTIPVQRCTADAVLPARAWLVALQVRFRRAVARAIAQSARLGAHLQDRVRGQSEIHAL